MLTSSPKLQYSMYKLWLVNYAMNQLFPLQQKKCTNADSTLNRVHCCIIKWGRWYWLVRKLSTSCMCIISILPPAAEAYFWVPNGSLPQAVCWTSQQRAAWIGCSAVSLVCKLIVCCHVCPCIVCACVCFWLNQHCWVQEFQFIRKREKEGVSKIWASRREDGASADNIVIFSRQWDGEVVKRWSMKSLIC